MKPRMLQLVTLSEWGGAQHIIYLLGKHFKQEYDITIACAPGGPLIERARAEGLRVVEISSLCRNPHLWKDLCAFRQIYRLMRSARFDIVHTHSTKAGLLGRLAARLAGVPVILFTAHGWAFTEGRKYWVRWLLAQIERLSSFASNKLICVSEHDRRTALKFSVASAEKLVTIYNGLAEIAPDHLVDRGHLRRELGIEESARVLTMVGRLAPQKDPIALVEACWTLSWRVPRWHLLIVGDGPLRAQTEQAIRARGLQGQITLLGERNDVPRILAASDIFVLPSRWEGLPLTIIEAMLAELPVVATRVGGVAELVEDAITGLLVPPNDPQALKRALAQLLEEAEVRKRMGEEGRRRALERFTIEHMISQTGQLYGQLLAARSWKKPR